MVSESQSLYQIEARLRAALEAPLPGAAAHLNLATRPRRGWHPGLVPPGAKTAAGLILLYPHYDTPHLLLTVRTGALPQHAGQVSFPGGSVERTETVPQAALREAAEEVGIDPRDVRVLGLRTTLYIPVSDFSLHPAIGVATERSGRRRTRLNASSRCRSASSSNRLAHGSGWVGDTANRSRCRTSSCATSVSGGQPPWSWPSYSRCSAFHRSTRGRIDPVNAIGCRRCAIITQLVTQPAHLAWPGRRSFSGKVSLASTAHSQTPAILHSV